MKVPVMCKFRINVFCSSNQKKEHVSCKLLIKNFLFVQTRAIVGPRHAWLLAARTCWYMIVCVLTTTQPHGCE
jgi:hypothetical protein